MRGLTAKNDNSLTILETCHYCFPKNTKYYRTQKEKYDPCRSIHKIIYISQLITHFHSVTTTHPSNLLRVGKVVSQDGEF